MPIRPRATAGELRPTGEPAPVPAEAAPTPAPAEAAPAALPPDVEPAPAPAPETISNDDLLQAFEALGFGTSQKALQQNLGITQRRARALLTKMEEVGMIGPPPKPGKERKILVTTWPPEVARATQPEPAPTSEPAPETSPETMETPPATPEAPPAPPTPESRGRWESIKSTFKSAYDRFVSKFRGEAQPEDNKEYKATGLDVTKAIASGALSVVTSYTGVKILADLPQWLYQKYWTNPAERQRIKNALIMKETELGESTEPSAIDQKKAKLEEAINASKFLSKEKKAELLGRLYTIVNEYESKDKTLRGERNEQIAKLLDEAIQTRIKNTQVLKEGLNSAFMLTGLSAMRGAAYGAVAVYERYKEVTKTPEGQMQWFRRTVVDGFTETMHNFFGGKEKLFSAKGGMNALKGATNVLRAVGFAELAFSEWTGEGRSVESIIDTSLKAWEQKGAGQFLADNAKAPWERLAGFAQSAKDYVAGGDSTTPPTPDAPPGAAGAPPSPDSPDAAAAAGAAGAGGVAAAEGAPSVEIPETQIEAGLVKKGDGIIKILERQGVEAKVAIDAAREAGIVRAGGDTRLTTEATGRLSVFTQTKPDGDIEIKFFDTQTDKVLTLAEAREAGFTYESGTVPGEIPTDREIVEHAPEPAPDTEVFTDSPAPNDLLEGTFHIYTDEKGNLSSLDVGEGDMLTRVNDAIQELNQTGYGESPEAKFLFEQYKALLASDGIEPATDLPAAEAAQRGAEEVRARGVAVDEVTGSAADEPIKKFVGEAGKVKFVYDKETDAVTDAFMPAYTPRPRDIEDALLDWGLTNKKVKAHFFEVSVRTDSGGALMSDSVHTVYPTEARPGFPVSTPENDYRQFIRSAERLARQEALLADMQENGYEKRIEYSYLKWETEQLEKFVTRKMTDEFKIKERRS